MLAEFIIIAVIAAYAVWVIVRKIRQFRQGKFCDCDCGSCPGQAKCRTKERDRGE